MPKRIQQRRTPGWRKPAGAVYVGRGRGAYGKWGNPCDWRTYPKWTGPYLPDGELDDDPRRIPDARRRASAVTDFESALITRRMFPRSGWVEYPSDEEIRRELAGKDLLCWCPPDQPCHADVLLKLANSTEEVPAS